MKFFQCSVFSVQCSVVLALLLAANGVAQPPPKMTDDVQDFVFFAEGRPLLIRAHVRVDGKSYRAVWDEYVNRVFKFLDADGDGVLSKKELERVPPLQFLTGNGFGGRVSAAKPAETLKPNKNGTVTRDEFAVFLRKSGAAPFQFQMGKSTGGVYGAKLIVIGQADPVSASALDDAIFQLLDTNKDGKLSREELAAASARFLTKDVNDDEMITPKELLPPAGNSGGFVKQDAAAVVVTTTQPTATTDGPVMLIHPGESGAALARRLIARYAPKGKTKLTAADLGIDRATFDRLDADKDGQLDAEELAQFAKRSPDLELTFQAGKVAEGETAVNGTAQSGGLEAKLSQPEKGKMQLAVGGTTLDIRAGTENPNTKMSFNFRLRDQYVNLFKMADTDNNGYLDEKEAMASPAFRGIFKALDTDGDGMLFEKEMVAYLDKLEEIQKAVQTGCVTLSLADQGNGLFDLIDRDHDGRLSVREMRGIVNLLKTLDKDGDGALSRSEIPRRFEMRVRQGPASNGDDFGNVVVVAKSFGPNGDQSGSDKGAGPVWFRKMDTNHDGDVSRREFLGTDEDFRRIDTDGDGLISLEEAERADKAMRKPTPIKK